MIEVWQAGEPAVLDGPLVTPVDVALSVIVFALIERIDIREVTDHVIEIDQVECPIDSKRNIRIAIFIYISYCNTMPETKELRGEDELFLRFYMTN